MTNDARTAASVRARTGGYVVDMVIFSAIAMVIVVIAGFVLLASTDWAQADASDAQMYLFLGIIGIGAPAVWSALNVALLATRSQTGGQYVAGIRMLNEGGGRLSPGKAAAWWFCFNPLLFSWPMAIVAGLPIAAVGAIVLGAWTVVLFGVVTILCVAMPLITLAAATIDAHNRTLHDRIVAVTAVPSA